MQLPPPVDPPPISPLGCSSAPFAVPPRLKGACRLVLTPFGYFGCFGLYSLPMPAWLLLLLLLFISGLLIALASSSFAHPHFSHPRGFFLRRPPDLVTSSFRLRLLSPADALALSALRSDPVALQFSHPWGCTPSKAQREISLGRSLFSQGQALPFAIASPSDGHLMGTILLTFYGPTRASVGYEIAPQDRGQGHASAALKLLANWAFMQFPALSRLEAWILPENLASIRVVESAGFRLEGTLRSRYQFGPTLRDVVVYSRLSTG